MDMNEMKNTAAQVLDACVGELAQAGKIGAGGTIVLGCSTSEVAGSMIGHGSVPELGTVLAGAMIDACRARGIEPCFQCCEHLNRSLVIEKRQAEKLGLTMVRAIPQPKAGGSVPAAAWKLLQ